MDRFIKIVIGFSLIGFAIYSANNWFFLGIIPLILGLNNTCLIKNVKEEDIKHDTNQINNDTKKSCCQTPSEQFARFSVNPPNQKVPNYNTTNDTIVIKILGVGCANCTTLKKVVDEAVKNMEQNFEIIKVEDMQEIMKYKLISTPGLVINEEVKSAGKVLNVSEVTTLINDMKFK
jgi:small redox-active disulfide protein 2